LSHLYLAAIITARHLLFEASNQSQDLKQLCKDLTTELNTEKDVTLTLNREWKLRGPAFSIDYTDETEDLPTAHGEGGVGGGGGMEDTMDEDEYGRKQAEEWEQRMRYREERQQQRSRAALVPAATPDDNANADELEVIPDSQDEAEPAGGKHPSPHDTSPPESPILHPPAEPPKPAPLPRPAQPPDYDELWKEAD
jgi:hypothetical protein